MKTTDISPEFIMLVGLPGSGKSTYIDKLLSQNSDKHFVVLSTDNILSAMADAEGLTYAEAFNQYAGQADKKFKIQFRQAKNDKSNIIIDRTNLTVKGRNKFLSQLPKEYYTKAIIFGVDRAELDRRLQKREIETGKHIPKHVVDNMEQSYVEPTASEFDRIEYV